VEVDSGGEIDIRSPECQAEPFFCFSPNIAYLGEGRHAYGSSLWTRNRFMNMSTSLLFA
jgi:hypothetical protein